MIRKYLVIIIFLSTYSCDPGPGVTPKPRMYPKIEFPERRFTVFNDSQCPFVFEKPEYVRAEKKATFFDDKPTHPCWLNLTWEPFQATVYLTYSPILADTMYDHLLHDAYTMVSKHNLKANYREEYQIQNRYGNSGMIFTIEGPVATPFQFYITDQERHFLRGSLYFSRAVQQDSLSPIIRFVEEDIEHILSTLRWKE